MDQDLLKWYHSSSGLWWTRTCWSDIIAAVQWPVMDQGLLEWVHLLLWNLSSFTPAFSFWSISQLYLWVRHSSSSAFPALSLGFIIFGEIFVYVTIFFYPIIEVVTFCLCGWCMLGVFVARIHPSRTWMSGSFEPMQWNASVHRLDLGLYSHPKEFWGNGVRTHVNSKGKIPSTRGSEVRTCHAASCRTVSPTQYRLRYSSPL